MAATSSERPLFFEGQYLGADDLAAIVDYLRTTTARQNLGQHAWGIAIGLDLTSVAVSETAVDYYVQPGVAIDGYGRIIVVESPTVISPDQAVEANIASGLVDVWIRYDQTDFEATRAGFEVCACDDDYRRIGESFHIELGNKTSITDRQSGVTVNDTLITDARKALREVDPEQELLCDASVPHQQLLVDDERSFWLVRLGHVRWDESTTSFLPLLDESASTGTSDETYERVISGRTKRRMIGVVAENVLAADGLIRLRRRTIPSDPDPSREIDPACNATDLQRADLMVCNGKLQPKELVWLEGNTRIAGDARLLDGRLEFRDESDSDYIDRTVGGQNLPAIQPLLLQRSERNSDDTNAGSDLQILLGDKGGVTDVESFNIRNRLVIGSVSFSGDDPCAPEVEEQGKVFVEDSGRVGIGTHSPDTRLSSPLTVRGFEQTLESPSGGDPVTTTRLLSFEDGTGATAWQMNLGEDNQSLSFAEDTAASSRLWLQAGGNIGVGTTEAEAKLDITSVSTSSGGSGLGLDLWFRVGNGGDGGRVWIEYGSQAAPLLVLSDKDDPPRLQFQQTDSADIEAEKAPAHDSWFGHARGSSADLAIVGGRLGVGSEVEHSHGVAIVQNAGAFGLYSGKNNGHTWMGFYNNGSPSSSPQANRGGWIGYGSDGNLDISVTNETTGGNIVLRPDARVEVRGDLMLGPTSQYFAVSSSDNLRVVVGRVEASGAESTPNSSFSVTRTAAGTYRITFNPAFASTPTVVAGVTSQNDHVASVHGVTSSQCEIRSTDVSGNEGELQNEAFNFIAIGER